MISFRPTLALLNQSSLSSVRAAAREALTRRAPPQPSFPIVSTCPSPSCACLETPSMPEGLEIDHSAHLNGTMPVYSQHVLISTGQADWKSRIEDEKDSGTSWGKTVGDLKKMLGRGGEFHDPHRNVVISTSSFKYPGHPSTAPRSQKESVPSQQQDYAVVGPYELEAIMFPTFQHIRSLPPTTKSAEKPIPQQQRQNENQMHQFIESFIPTPATTTQDHNTNTNSHSHNHSLSSNTAIPFKTEPITTPTILICSHGSRDQRCGVLGPLLHAEFARVLSQLEISGEKRFQPCSSGFTPASAHPPSTIIATKTTGSTLGVEGEATSTTLPVVPINLGMISHVGGHKWAGNVIVYIPPSFQHVEPGSSGEVKANSLSGSGIWYGRVEPRHVEGIVMETLVRGRVIKDLFRGGIDVDGKIIRL